MKKKLFLMIALLCAVVQGVWAAEWDDVRSPHAQACILIMV